MPSPEINGTLFTAFGPLRQHRRRPVLPPEGRHIDCLGRGDPDSEVLVAWQRDQQVGSVCATGDLAAGKKLADKIVVTFASCLIGEIPWLGRALRQWKCTYWVA